MAGGARQAGPERAKQRATKPPLVGLKLHDGLGAVRLRQVDEVN